MDELIGSEGVEDHARFVRRLAAHLVRDPHRADDVAQETWLHWFFRPPHDRSQPRRWLARVTRGVASNQRRREGRRADLERDAHPAEPAGGSPLDSLRQAEAIERVAAAVRALEEPYRAVVLARYFRGLSVRELAHESGTSEDTLRTRERRALEQLRVKLDRDYGTREGWALALGPFLKGGGPAPFAEASSDASAPIWTSLAVLAAVTACVLVAWHALARAPIAGEPTSVGSSPAVAESSTPLELAPPRARTREIAASSDSAPLAVTNPPLAEVRGRFLLADGTPAAGASWWLEGMEANSDLVELFGLPENWEDPEGTLADDGTLLLRLDPPRAYQFTLGVYSEGHASSLWDLDLEPGGTTDLGTVALERAATVVGHVRDAGGVPILGERLSVRATPQFRDFGNGRDFRPSYVEVDPGTGQFLIEGITPGLNEIEVTGVHEGTTSTRLWLAAGEVHELDLVYAGPREGTRIQVSAFWAPDFLQAPDLAHVRLFGDDERAIPASGTSRPTTFTFDGLAAGRYRLEITDPRFEPWSQADLAPGATVRARLVPDSRVWLTARDEAGHILAPEALTIGLLRERSAPAEKVLFEAGKCLDGRVPLLPGNHRLRVRSGWLEGVVEVQGLVLGESRTVEVVLRERASVAGQLVRPDGTPIAFHDVLVLAPAGENDSDASPIAPAGSGGGSPNVYRRILAVATSDVDGTFRAKAPVGTEFLVHARHPGGAHVSTKRMTLEPGAIRTGLELVLPEGVLFSGRVLAPPGIDPTGLRVWVVPASADGQFRTFFFKPVTSDDEGRFTLAGLEPGRYGVLVALPALQRSQTGSEASGMRGWNPLELGTVEVASGQELAPEFSLLDQLGAVELDVRIEGGESSWGIVQLSKQANNTTLHGRTDPRGGFGPTLAFTGDWSVEISDPGGEWKWRAPDRLQVAGGEFRRTSFSLVVAERCLRFLDAEGRPLANTRIDVQLDHPEELRAFRRLETDAEGRATLRLVAGDYLFSRAGGPTTRLSWTTTDPMQNDVRL